MTLNWLCRNAGRANQIAERVWYVILSHDFRVNCVIGFIFIVDMARSAKVDKLYKLSTSKAVSSAALQVGYKQLKHKQNKAVDRFVNGRDVFISFPRGSGKSLCYAVLPAVNVRSPLRTALR